MRNKDKPWFNDQYRRSFGLRRRFIFGRAVIALGLTEKSLSAVKGELMKPTRLIIIIIIIIIIIYQYRQRGLHAVHP